MGVKRIMPCIREDGCLYLAKNTIEDFYACDIKKFLKDLKVQPDQSLSFVSKIVIDDIKVEEQDLLDIFESLLYN